MSVQITRHILRPDMGGEVVDFIDCHGRKMQIFVPILDMKGNPRHEDDIQAEIDQHLKAFSSQEAHISKHIEKRFHPKTLERKVDKRSDRK